METIHQPELFRCIQEFLSAADYLALMNANQLHFHPIKRKTIKYSLKLCDTTSLHMINAVNEVVKKVETPNAQISLCVLHPSRDFYNLFPRIAPFLHTFHLIAYVSQNMNFFIFNNIPVVKLFFVGNVKITGGLQNIKSLSLAMSQLIESHNFNEINSLKEFTLEVGHQKRLFLKDLPVRTDFHEQYQILYREQLKWDLPARFSFKSKENNNFLSIVKLGLHGDFSSSQLDFDFIAKIEDVDLSHKGNLRSVISLPVFQGKRLILTGFHLCRWNKQLEMPNIRELLLKDCSLGVVRTLVSSPFEFEYCGLPSMPNIKRLRLIGMKDLQSLRTFPRCECLLLDGLELLEHLSPQPRLREFEVVDCPSIFDYSSLDGQYFSALRINSTYIRDLTWARNTRTLLLQEKCHLLNLTGLRGSSIPGEERECLIDGVNNTDFSPLSGWKRVSIAQVKRFGDESDPTQLSDVHDLNIFKCPNYHSTSNLHNIKNALNISDCKNLKSLKNLQNIPEIILSNLPQLRQISGLGSNDRVVALDVPFLEKAWKKYSKAKLANRAEKDYYHPIFSTIKTFNSSIGSKCEPKGDDSDDDMMNDLEE